MRKHPPHYPIERPGHPSPPLPLTPPPSHSSAGTTVSLSAQRLLRPFTPPPQDLLPTTAFSSLSHLVSFPSLTLYPTNSTTDTTSLLFHPASSPSVHSPPTRFHCRLSFFAPSFFSSFPSSYPITPTQFYLPTAPFLSSTLPFLHLSIPPSIPHSIHPPHLPRSPANTTCLSSTLPPFHQFTHPHCPN